jgi:hypothetical protein
MSYCRMGEDSDVYVYHSVFGGMVCVCVRNPPLMTKPQMVEHLLEHRDDGWQVPQRALDRLYREIVQEEEKMLEDGEW